MKYKIGDVTHAGQKITTIISQNDKCLVFFDEEKVTCFEYNDTNPSNTSKILEKYHDVAHLIPSDLPPRTSHNLKVALGTAAASALSNCNGDIKDILKYFDSIESRIRSTISPSIAKLILIIVNLVLTIVVVLFCIMVYINSPSVYSVPFLCAGMGCFGSLFSLLQRNSLIELPLIDGVVYIIVQAIFICMLGGMSGFVAYLLMKSGIALSLFQGNIYSLSLICILSGFSERFIPDLFESIEKK